MLRLFKGKQIDQMSEQVSEDTLVAVFGRFNPPHAGHLKLFDSARRLSETLNCPYLIFPSESNRDSYNPLSISQRIDLIREFSPIHSECIAPIDKWGNFYGLVEKLSSTYKCIHFVMGSDSYPEIKSLCENYGTSVDIRLHKIEVLSESNMKLSSSHIRSFALSDDYSSYKSFYTNCYESIILDSYRSTVRANIFDETNNTDSSELKESYFQNKKFVIGSRVYSLNSMIEGTVVFRGPNYVVIESDDKNRFKFWIGDLAEKVHWEVGTDVYRIAMQKLTPGQPVTKNYSKFPPEKCNTINSNSKKSNPIKNEPNQCK